MAGIFGPTGAERFRQLRDERLQRQQQTINQVPLNSPINIGMRAGLIAGGGIANAFDQSLLQDPVLQRAQALDKIAQDASLIDDPGSPTFYRTLASELSRNGFMDEAIQVAAEGRQAEQDEIELRQARRNFDLTLTTAEAKAEREAELERTKAATAKDKETTRLASFKAETGRRAVEVQEKFAKRGGTGGGRSVTLPTTPAGEADLKATDSDINRAMESAGKSGGMVGSPIGEVSNADEMRRWVAETAEALVKSEGLTLPQARARAAELAVQGIGPDTGFNMSKHKWTPPTSTAPATVPSESTQGWSAATKK